METNLGVAIDPRPDSAKFKDYAHIEVAASSPVSWVPKAPAQWKQYSIRNQDGSSSCCGQAAAKALEVLTGQVQSAHPIYRSRSNFSAKGMWLQDVGNILKKQGTTTEDKDISQNMNEDEMNRPLNVETPVKISAYVSVDVKNIDAIAQAIEAQKHCCIIVHGSLSEWKDVPVFNPNKPVDFGHCICAVDYFLYNGEKAVLIDESWGQATTLGNKGQRILTESYLRARASGGIYFVKDAPAPDNKPLHKFKNILSYGLMKNPDVKALQDILKFEGLFPASLTSTGNYLEITSKSVLNWQKKHNVASLEELNGLYGRRCGPKTISKLNELYSI